MNKRSFVGIWLSVAILAALFVFALAQPRPAEAWDCSNLEVKKTGGFSVEATFKYDALGNEHVELNWGDGSSMSLPTGHDVKRTESHTYADYGTYHIVLKVFNADKSDFIECSGTVDFPRLVCEETVRIEGPWSEWRDNGDGREVRERTIKFVDSEDNSLVCDEKIETEYRPILCYETVRIEGPWSEWRDNGDGREVRERTITFMDSEDNSLVCDEKIETEYRRILCYETIRIEGPWSEWQDNGDGRQVRERTITFVDSEDNSLVCEKEIEKEYRPCEEDECPPPDIDCKQKIRIEGSWSEWTDWSEIRDGVDGRTRTFTREGISRHGDPQVGAWNPSGDDWKTRSRRITWDGVDANGNTGPDCDLYQDQEERRTTLPPCESSGGSWSRWSPWSDMGDRVERRTRSFTREGISRHGTPQEGEWSPWTPDGQWETRSRRIIWDGIYANGNTGPDCDLYEDQEERQPIDQNCNSTGGAWSEWSEWTISGDVEGRTRSFTRDGISRDGDPQIGEWSPWTRDGEWDTRARTRTWDGVDDNGKIWPECDLFEDEQERRSRPDIPPTCENPKNSIRTIGPWSDWQDNGDGRDVRSRTVTYEGVENDSLYCTEDDYRTRPPKPTCENPKDSVRTVGPWSEWQDNEDGTQSRTRTITYQIQNSKPVTCPEIEVRDAPAPHLGLCYDPEFELEIRRDPQTGYYRAWRIWTDDNGYQLDELDLFRRFARFDTVAEWMDASIEPNSRCQFVISLRFEGSDQFDLFRFSSYGSSYLQLTDTPDLNEINPEWTPMMWIDFSEANTLYKIHPNSTAVLAKVINGFHLLGDEIDSSTDPTGRLEVFSAEGAIYVLDNLTDQLYRAPFSGQSPAWTPDMTGITVHNGELMYTLDFATGRRTYGSLGQRIVWAPNRWLAGAAHIDYVADQRYWKDKTTGKNLRRTGTPFHPPMEGLKSRSLKDLYLEHIESEITHEPIDWRIDPTMGQTVDMNPVMDWLATLEPVDLLRASVAEPVERSPGAN